MLKNKSPWSHIVLATLFVAIVFSSQSQTHTVSGYIRDASNGESLIGATVYDSKLGSGTVANNFGFYSISVGDSAILSCSFVGYTSRKFFLKLSGDTSIVVLLNSGRILDEVVVKGDHIEKIHETTRTGTINLPVAQVKSIPAFAGEVDVVKALQLLPGVSGGYEGSSGMLVRGGSADQTLILMDGVPIYNPSHLYGLFSSFNADAVNNIELVKGGFPARYGGRLSGIADITLREGNSNKFSGAATVGLLASKLLLEGPIVKGKTSFLLSARASYLTLMRPLMETKVGQARLDGYRFHDINAKVNHRINAKNRLYASVYSGRDRMRYKYASTNTDSTVRTNIIRRTDTYVDKMDWENLLTSLRWNHEINSTSFFNVTAYRTTYDIGITESFKRHEEFLTAGGDSDYFSDYQYKSRIADVGLTIDFDHRPNTKHYIRYGAAGILHAFRPAAGANDSSDPTRATTPVNTPIDTREVNGYIEDDVDLTSKLKMNAGVHGVFYNTSGKNYSGIQPRFSFRYSLANNLSVKASYSYMQQFLQTLVNGGLGMPTEVWVPAFAKVKPQTSHQVSIGVAQTAKEGLDISVEGFYKTMSNLLEYKEGTTYLNNDEPWYDKIEHGRGVAYGAEFFVHKKTGRFTGFVSYTLSWNKRQFDNINDGEWYYFRFDRRHDFKITGNYTLNNPKFDLSATWIFGTGNSITAPVGQFATGSITDYAVYQGRMYPRYYLFREYQARGNYRMQPYHRLDVNLNYSFKKWGLEQKASIGFYNTYDRLNPFYIMYDSNRNRMVSVSLFPIMPGVSYSIKF